jgi:hypothetical protein
MPRRPSSPSSHSPDEAANGAGQGGSSSSGGGHDSGASGTLSLLGGRCAAKVENQAV